MRRGWWPVAGFVLGAIAGGLWGYYGSGGYEAGDSALGTAFLCSLAGLLLGGIATTVAERRERRR